METYNLTPVKFFFILITLFTGYNKGFCQQKQHEFSVSAGGIFSYISYDLKEGYLKEGEGGSLGVRYSYYLNNNWSIGLGAEYQSYNTDGGILLLNDRYMTIDSEGEEFEFRYTATRLKEEQKLSYFAIPVNVQYEGSGAVRFYASAGAKVGFALSATYQTSIEELQTSGYYPQYNAELFDPAFMGFSNFGKVEFDEKDLDVNMAYSATAEAGIKQLYKNNVALYIGLFMDYGLNNIVKNNNNRNIVDYPVNEVPVVLQNNSVLESRNAGSARLMAFGVKFRFAM